MVTHKPFIVDDLQSGQLIQLSKLELSLTKGYYLVYPYDSANDVELGRRQFIVLDPDGYMLRFSQDLGKREIKI